MNRHDHPESFDVAVLYRENQLLSIEGRRPEIDCLIEMSPNQIDTNKPIKQWLGMETSNEEAIAGLDPRYQEILKQTDHLRCRDRHSDGNLLRRVLSRGGSPDENIAESYQ